MPAFQNGLRPRRTTGGATFNTGNAANQLPTMTNTSGAPAPAPQMSTGAEQTGNVVRGAPGNVNPAWNPQGGVSPFNASAGATGIGEFQRFADNAYNESERRLTPQFEAQQRSFEQDMVNRGIAPGTPAYDNARQNFEQSRNDAFASARANADQQGMQAQQQSFMQGATNSAGLRDLILGRQNFDASIYGSDASMYNSDNAANTAANNLDWQRQQGDFGNLMQLLGFGQGITGFNNGAANQNNQNQVGQYNMNTGMLGLLPGQTDIQPINTQAGYRDQYNAQLNQANMNQQQQNANNQMYAQMFASLWCDRNAKDTIGPVNPEDTLKAIKSIPVDCWTYKEGDRTPHIGTYAQDFNAALGLPDDTKINVIDMLGALIGSVQALAAQNERLAAEVEQLRAA